MIIIIIIIMITIAVLGYFWYLSIIINTAVNEKVLSTLYMNNCVMILIAHAVDANFGSHKQARIVYNAPVND